MAETTIEERKRSQQEANMDVLVGYILLVGVLLSITLIIAGLVWRWFRTGTIGVAYGIQGMNLFQFLSQDVQRLRIGYFRPRLLVNWGIAVLMLTPYTRVGASILYFALVEHNWKYTVFTAFVFSVLTYSLFLS